MQTPEEKREYNRRYAAMHKEDRRKYFRQYYRDHAVEDAREPKPKGFWLSPEIEAETNFIYFARLMP